MPLPSLPYQSSNPTAYTDPYPPRRTYQPRLAPLALGIAICNTAFFWLWPIAPLVTLANAVFTIYSIPQSRPGKNRVLALIALFLTSLQVLFFISIALFLFTWSDR